MAKGKYITWLGKYHSFIKTNMRSIIRVKQYKVHSMKGVLE